MNFELTLADAIPQVTTTHFLFAAFPALCCPFLLLHAASVWSDLLLYSGELLLSEMCMLAAGNAKIKDFVSKKEKLNTLSRTVT